MCCDNSSMNYLINKMKMLKYQNETNIKIINEINNKNNKVFTQNGKFLKYVRPNQNE
jgi:hypothetical protein